MRYSNFLWLAAFAVTVASCKSPDKQVDKDPVVPYSSDDAEMNGAIAKARASLPEFFKHWKRPRSGETDFGLKVRIKDGGYIEHFWTIHLEGSPGHLTGEINNEPEAVHNVKFGERVPIPDDQISDWTYLRNGKIVGGYTLRVMLKQMDPVEAKKLKSQLADP